MLMVSDNRTNSNTNTVPVIKNMFANVPKKVLWVETGLVPI